MVPTSTAASLLVAGALLLHERSNAEAAETPRRCPRDAE
jgi:hypothetical protein